VVGETYCVTQHSSQNLVVRALRAIHRRTRHCIANQDSDPSLVGDSSYGSGNRRFMVNSTIAKMEQSRIAPAAMDVQQAIFVVAVAAHLCAIWNVKIEGKCPLNRNGHVPLHMRRWWGLALPRTVPAGSKQHKGNDRQQPKFDVCVLVE
jgi:hypothetical protein